MSDTQAVPSTLTAVGSVAGVAAVTSTGRGNVNATTGETRLGRS